MPRPSDDRFFGGGKGAARKAYEAILKQYGYAKGEQVYNALLNKRRALTRARQKAQRS